MTLIEIAQLGAMGILTVGAGYWGGQVKRAVDALCNGQADHEKRIRELEKGPTVYLD